MNKIKKSKSQYKIEQEMIRGSLRGLLYYSPVLIGFMAFAISLSLGCFIIGFTGVIVAVKKESPSGLNPARGKTAVFIGVLHTIFFWILAAIFFLIELAAKK